MVEHHVGGVVEAGREVGDGFVPEFVDLEDAVVDVGDTVDVILEDVDAERMAQPWESEEGNGELRQRRHGGGQHGQPGAAMGRAEERLQVGGGLRSPILKEEVGPNPEPGVSPLDRPTSSLLPPHGALLTLLVVDGHDGVGAVEPDAADDGQLGVSPVQPLIVVVHSQAWCTHSRERGAQSPPQTPAEQHSHPHPALPYPQPS